MPLWCWLGNRHIKDDKIKNAAKFLGVGVEDFLLVSKNILFVCACFHSQFYAFVRRIWLYDSHSSFCVISLLALKALQFMICSVQMVMVRVLNRKDF